MINLYDIVWGAGVGVSAPFWLVKPSARQKVLSAFRQRMGRDVARREIEGGAAGRCAAGRDRAGREACRPDHARGGGFDQLGLQRDGHEGECRFVGVPTQDPDV